MSKRRIVLLGAAGRDFHDFNVVYRDDPAAEVVAFTATQIRRVFETWKHLGCVLPAVGYDEAQVAALRATIEGSRAEVVVSGTPLDLPARIGGSKPVVRVRYALEDVDRPGLGALVDDFVAQRLG